MGQAGRTCALESQKGVLSCCHTAAGVRSLSRTRTESAVENRRQDSLLRPEGYIWKTASFTGKKKATKSVDRQALGSVPVVCQLCASREEDATTKRTFWTPARLSFALRRGHSRDTHERLPK